MKVNIQNYETYFLLYIDNALSAADRIEVEMFIQENPALANEITLLKQTVLTPEHIVFEDKALLYRYGEMNASLPASFKQSLYRTEAKVVTGFFTRRRMAAMASIAALFIVLIGYQLYFTPTIEEKKLVNNTNTAQTNINEISTTANINAPEFVDNNIIAKPKRKVSIETDDNLFISNNEPIAKENNLSQQETNTASTLNFAPDITNSITPETTLQSNTDHNISSNAENETSVLNRNDVISNEEGNYNNINFEDRDRSIYIANFEIDGEKLRGVTRRINAIFKRNKNEKQK